MNHYTALIKQAEDETGKSLAPASSWDWDPGKAGWGAVGALAGGTGLYLLGRLIHGKKKKWAPWLYALGGALAGGAGGYYWSGAMPETKKEPETGNKPGEGNTAKTTPPPKKPAKPLSEHEKLVADLAYDVGTAGVTGAVSAKMFREAMKQSDTREAKALEELQKGEQARQAYYEKKERIRNSDKAREDWINSEIAGVKKREKADRISAGTIVPTGEPGTVTIGGKAAQSYNKAIKRRAKQDIEAIRSTKTDYFDNEAGVKPGDREYVKNTKPPKGRMPGAGTRLLTHMAYQLPAAGTWLISHLAKPYVIPSVEEDPLK